MARPRKLTAAVKKFIIRKVEEGLDISEICTKYASDVGCGAATIYRQQASDAEFNQRLMKAYDGLFMMRADEERKIASPEHLQYLIDKFDGNLNAAKAAQSSQLKSAQYQLTKIAPKLSNKFDKPSKVEVIGGNMPTIVINDWFKQQENIVSEDKDGDVLH